MRSLFLSMLCVLLAGAECNFFPDPPPNEEASFDGRWVGELNGSSTYKSPDSPAVQAARQKSIEVEFESGDLRKITVVEPNGWYEVPAPVTLDLYSLPDVIVFTREGQTITVTASRRATTIDDLARSYTLEMDVRYEVSGGGLSIIADGTQTSVFTLTQDDMHCRITSSYTILDSRLNGPAEDMSDMQGLLHVPSVPPPVSELDGDWLGEVTGEGTLQENSGTPVVIAKAQSLSLQISAGELVEIIILPPQGVAFPSEAPKLSHVGDSDRVDLVQHTYSMRVTATVRELEITDDAAHIVVDFEFTGANPGNSFAGTGTQIVDLVPTADGLSAEVFTSYDYERGFRSGPALGNPPVRIEESSNATGMLKPKTSSE